MIPSLHGERPGTRKNFVMNTEEGVSFKIKPNRINMQESDQRRALLENDEIAHPEEEIFTSYHTPIPDDKHQPTQAAARNINKIMPFNPGEIIISPEKQESPNKDIINIEKSVLNSRFIVE